MIFLFLLAFDTKTATKVILFLQTKYTSIQLFFFEFRRSWAKVQTKFKYSSSKKSSKIKKS